MPLDYDPLLAKLTVWSDTRTSAIERMRRAVSEYRVLGIKTNLGLFSQLMRDAAWVAGDLDTGFLERFMQTFKTPTPSAEAAMASLLAAAQDYTQSPQLLSQAQQPASLWRAAGRQGLMR